MECQMTIISVEMMKWVRTVPRPANHFFITKKRPKIWNSPIFSLYLQRQTLTYII